MGNLKLKTEGGSGGKRGHSNMEHWVYTEEIKEATKTRRRLEDRILSEQAMSQFRSARPPSRKTGKNKRKK